MTAVAKAPQHHRPPRARPVSAAKLPGLIPYENEDGLAIISNGDFVRPRRRRPRAVVDDQQFIVTEFIDPHQFAFALDKADMPHKLQRNVAGARDADLSFGFGETFHDLFKMVAAVEAAAYGPSSISLTFGCGTA